MHATVPTSCPPNMRKEDRRALIAHLLYTHMTEVEQARMKHGAGRNQVPLLSSVHSPHLPINQQTQTQQAAPTQAPPVSCLPRRHCSCSREKEGEWATAARATTTEQDPVRNTEPAAIMCSHDLPPSAMTQQNDTKHRQQYQTSNLREQTTATNNNKP